ncbi:hypothetical protein R3P38DRAFT_2575894 [Favolaschia claudopus]|uniref:Uncharacterized protein n=1 Tax=Favolaschia claudopus TaxID=2862362 RepID=A0AAV9ZJW9_9AGAR
MSESYEAYSAPHPKTRFSPQFMANVTLGEVVGLVRDDLLPRILPDGSVSKWNWDQTVPVTIPETIVSSREEIPSMADMQPIMADAKQAFYQLGVNSVCIQFKSGAIVRYHFSKLRLIVGANNQDYNFRLMSRLLARVERESLLSPALFEELKLNRFAEPLAGFSVTQTPLYNLGCLLDERWILDDIMNARAEFIYFRRAAMFPGVEPSFIFLPTSFVENARELRKVFEGIDNGANLHREIVSPYCRYTVISHLHSFSSSS